MANNSGLRGNGADRLPLLFSGETWENLVMPKRVKQKRRTNDENEIAFQLVQRATQEPEPNQDTTPAVPASISEYMAKIGSKGGKIGGKRRLKTMTSEQRRNVAKKAAATRWKTAKKKPPRPSN